MIKWYLVIQLIHGNYYQTANNFPTERACKADALKALAEHRIGMLANPMTDYWCVSQRNDENSFPKSRKEGAFTCKYPVGMCTKASN